MQHLLPLDVMSSRYGFAMTERQFVLSVPMDNDGFLRRECPKCEREFKWLPTQEGQESTPVPEGGYFCPYCGKQADAGAWHTKAQVEQMKAIAYDELVAPELEGFKRSVEEMDFGGGPLNVRAEVSIEGPGRPAELEEPDDMRRVDFPCHPSEPVKVSDGWQGDVHCLVCGTALAS